MDAGVVATRLARDCRMKQNRQQSGYGQQPSTCMGLWQITSFTKQPVVKTGVTSTNKEEFFTEGCMEGVPMIFLINTCQYIHCETRCVLKERSSVISSTARRPQDKYSTRGRNMKVRPIGRELRRMTGVDH